jgi:hypothetical protein
MYREAEAWQAETGTPSLRMPEDRVLTPSLRMPESRALRIGRFLLEALAVLVSPVALFYVLRLRPMAPQWLPDPSLHSAFIFDPRDVFTRYWGAYPAAHFREGARVGFLIPARLAYVLFGGVPGFFVTRYFFALVAVVPTYLLLRRLYGVAAGALGIIVVISSPVLVTAWGTDYPDSAAVSYLAGALACLAMPSRARTRVIWVTLSGLLMTLAVWSHGSAVFPLIGTLVAYAIVMVLRDGRHLIRDVAVLAGAAVVTTGLLEVGSTLVLGEWRFISLTLQSWSFLNKPGVLANYHSMNWAWAPYRVYLLVLPAVVIAFAVAFARRLRAIPTPQLLVGLACTAQVLVACYVQFFAKVEMLEMRYFSSLVWGGVCVALAVTLSELARPLFSLPILRWMPAFAALVVPLVYETVRRDLPAERWSPVGFALLAVAVAAAIAGRLLLGVSPSVRRAGAHSDLSFARSRVRHAVPPAVTLVLVVLIGSTLVLTVLPEVHEPPTRGVARLDPPSDYYTALGGQAGILVDQYRIAAQIPRFVGNATYRREELLTWHPHQQIPELLQYLDLYHGGLNQLTSWPELSPRDKLKLRKRRPAEILLIGLSVAGFRQAKRALGPYSPSLDRTTEITSGPIHVYVWLLTLGAYYRSPST